MMRRTLSRRRLLHSAAVTGVGAAALALVGCSVEEQSEAQQQEQQETPPEQQQTQQQQAQQQQAQQQEAPAEAEEDAAPAQDAAAESPAPLSPMSGGVLRSYLPIERFDSWDPHRSRYRYAQSVHSLVYSRLLQPADPHSGELRADLCGPPETPDQATYVFALDPRAAFWDQAPTDGRAVSVDDIRLNIERQQQGLDAAGNPDPYLFRSRAWNRAEFSAGEGGAFTLRTSAPDAPFLGSVAASPFAWIISREALEDAAPAWLDDPFDHALVSGSGPYIPTAYDRSFELTLARSQNWWGEAEIQPDEVQFVGGPTDDLIFAYIDARIDRADFPLTNESVEALREEHPEHTPFELPLDAPVQLLAPLDSAPGAALGDPRVIRALSIAVDRRRLIERLYAGQGRPSGPLPWYLDGWALAGDQLTGYPGYRTNRSEDRAEAAALIAAAGGAAQIAPVPFAAADLFEGFFPGAGPFLRDQLQEATGLTLELEFRPFAEALSQLQEGERFLFLGWGETPSGPDPTDRWREQLHSAGAENWGGAADPQLDSLIEQMQSTFDLDARRDLCRQVQALLLSGNPSGWIHNLANGLQLGVSQPWLHLDPRALAYAWSTQHLATSWLDTSEGSGYPAEQRTPPEPEEPAEADESE